jgi:hypothetical protein
MRSHRGGWLRSWVLSATLVLAPAVSTTVRAQPGFGPDPFWPYNKQYTPYTTAVGPASPDAGQSSAFMGRQGYSTANQFQDYVEGMSGSGRNSSDRANVGVPYFRGSVDPAYGGADREYRPNAGTADDYEKKQQEITKKYFAYFSERDPTKRARLLHEYQQARRESTRELGSRGQSPSRALSEASRNRGGSGSSRAPRDDMSLSIALPHEPGTISRSATSTSRSDDVDSSQVQGRTTRRAPPMPSVPPFSSGTRTRTPTGALNRALNAADRRGELAPGSTTTTRRRRTAPGLAPPPTNPE